MASKRSRKAKAREALAYQQDKLFAAVTSSTASVFTFSDKDTKSEPVVQHPCTKCPQWTVCVGYVQHKQCLIASEKRKAERKEVRDE